MCRFATFLLGSFIALTIGLIVELLSPAAEAIASACPEVTCVVHFKFSHNPSRVEGIADIICPEEISQGVKMSRHFKLLNKGEMVHPDKEREARTQAMIDGKNFSSAVMAGDIPGGPGPSAYIHPHLKLAFTRDATKVVSESAESQKKDISLASTSPENYCFYEFKEPIPPPPSNCMIENSGEKAAQPPYQIHATFLYAETLPSA